MKKSLLALLVASVFLLNACDEQNAQELNQKLQQAQQQVSRLESKAIEDEKALVLAQMELDKVKQELAKQPAFPALDVEIYPVFSASEVVKHQRDPKEDDEFFREETLVEVFLSNARTGIEWLDRLLAESLYPDAPIAKDFPLEKLDQELSDRGSALHQNVINEAKADKSIGYSFSIKTNYLGQKGYLVNFSRFHYQYIGGAHGMHWTSYLNIDTRSQKILTLSDLFSAENLEKIRPLLAESYRYYNAERGVDKPFYNPENEPFEIAEQFYFNQGGLTFVYPPYAIGSFAEGEIELTVPWSEINHLLEEPYRLGKKDGFGLAPESAFE